jgi:hypothetical protein
VKLITAPIANKLLRSRPRDVAKAEDATRIVVKYFTPDAGASWYIIDGARMSDGDWELFGLCDLGAGMPELGYVMLSDLQRIRGRLGLKVERDLHWAGTLADARKILDGRWP